MERIRALDRYQKGILLLVATMVLVFAVVYPITMARVGFVYQDALLRPSQENGSTVYSGKIHGKAARFTISPEQSVEFQYGDQLYGPYTAKEDPTAIPQEDELRERMTGVEIRQGENVIFRGGVLTLEGDLWLFGEDGLVENSSFSMGTSVSGGTITEEHGRVIDPMEPTAAILLELLSGTHLTHKGDWVMWLSGNFLCVLTAISVLFADEIFRWNLRFQIRNVDQAEPSDWEITWRYIGWTALPIMALILFIMGLQ